MHTPHRLAFLLLAGLLVLAAPSQASASASSFYEDALELVAEDDLPAAAIQLKNAIQADPGYLPAHILLGRVHLRQGQGADAQKAVEEAVQRGADPSLTLELLGEALLLQNEFSLLLEQVSAERLSGDLKAGVLVLRGRALAELERLDDAAESFREAADAAPRLATPLAGLATVRLRRSDLAGAAELAARAVEVEPSSADAWNISASVKHAGGALEQALAEYGRAIELDPEHFEARVARAGIHLDLGRVEDAAADIEVAKELVPYDPRVTYVDAVVQTKLGNREAARDALSATAMSVDGLRQSYLLAHPTVVLTGGLAHYGLGQVDQARDYLSRYVAAVPSTIGPRRLLGTIHFGNSDLEAAQSVLEPVLQSAPGDYETLSLLAQVYARRGLHESAVNLLEQALVLSGESDEIRTRLAMSEVGAGRVARGIEQLRDAFGEGAGFRPAGVSLAVMLLREGRPDEAIDVSRKLIENNPEDLTARNLLASAQVAAGLRDAARESLLEILRMAPDFIPARINLGKLEIGDGELQAARARFDQILAEYPEHIESMLEMARLERVSGNDEEALKWLEKARVVGGSTATRPRVRLVEFHLASGDSKRALEVAQEAASGAPENPAVLRALASAYIAAGNNAVAHTVYRDLATLVGFDAEALYRIAREQLASGAQDDALYSLEKAINSAPDFLPAQVGAIEILLRQGKLERAEERALSLRNSYPAVDSGYRLYGEALLARQACGEGVPNLKKALELRAREALAVRVATALQRCGRGGDAMAFLEDWLSGRPEQLFARKALAELSLANGLQDQAMTHYEAVLDGFPDEVGVLNNLAYLYQQQDLARALDYARRAHQLEPGSARVNDTLGWILVQNGAPAAALPYLREAHSRDSRNPTIRWHLARALHDLGRDSEARSEIRIALDMGVEFDELDAARELYDKLVN